MEKNARVSAEAIISCMRAKDSHVVEIQIFDKSSVKSSVSPSFTWISGLRHSRKVRYSHY